VKSWSTERVETFIESLRAELGKATDPILAAFASEEIDGDALMKLRQGELSYAELKVPMGARGKINTALDQLQAEYDARVSQQTSPPPLDPNLDQPEEVDPDALNKPQLTEQQALQKVVKLSKNQSFICTDKTSPWAKYMGDHHYSWKADNGVNKRTIIRILEEKEKKKSVLKLYLIEVPSDVKLS
jgi:hypothetical protein